jgi:hypothetical protein
MSSCNRCAADRRRLPLVARIRGRCTHVRVHVSPIARHP